MMQVSLVFIVEKVMTQQQSMDYNQVMDQIVLCTTTPDDPSCRK